MSEPIAIILAAGFGTRLAPLTDLRPKGLVEFCGDAMLAHSVRKLRSAGVPDIRIITGHHAVHIEDRFRGEPGVTVIHNPAYSDTGSLNTLLTGLANVPVGASRVLVLESDIIYEERAVRILLDGGTTILTSGRTGAGDEVYVWAEANAFGPAQLVALSKDKHHLSAPALGELTGLNALAGADLEVLIAAFQEHQATDPMAHYEDGLVHAAKSIAVHCHLEEGIVWAEIDDEAMLAHAEAHVWPKISQRDRDSGL